MRRLTVAIVAATLAVACHRPAPLTSPAPKGLDAVGPDSFPVRFTTTRGPFDLKVHRDWSPRGADRIYWLVNNRYYDGVRFYRVVPNFVVQFGMNGDTAVQRPFRDRRIPDDTGWTRTPTSVLSAARSSIPAEPSSDRRGRFCRTAPHSATGIRC